MSYSLACAAPAPTASPRARVKSPTWRTWMETYGSNGHEVMVKGCHWYLETEGTLMNSHCPALYRKDGFENWISTTSSSRLVYLNCTYRVIIRTIRMANNTSNLCCPTSSDFTVQTFNQIDSTTEKLPSPSFVTKTVFPEWFTGKRRVGICRVTHKATDSVRVHTQQEGDEKVVCVPECLKGLLANSVMGRGVHEQHAEEHNVASDAARLGVMDLNRKERSYLGPLNVEETW